MYESKERIKIKFYAKIRLSGLSACTTSTIRYRKFKISIIYNMNILSIFTAIPKNEIVILYHLHPVNDSFLKSIKLFLS
ncbi:hypothetical protein DRF59_08400 [Chryseobacterium flavum]|uniref:Uncharacterized protein n=1 Tax=Chryseobacterium flavum TaxID=415851 RepID=A0A3D9CPC8_9FLAO|nr:hypothetical protein DRF59_08400 [Chryseobacterium flavum]